MAVLAALLLGTLAARLADWLGADYADSWPAAIAVGLGAMFVLMLVMLPATVHAARMPNPPKSMTTRLDLRTV